MIFKENDRFENIYFLKSGEFLLTKTVFLTKNNRIFEKMETTKADRLISFLNYKILPVAICSANELMGYEGFLEMAKTDNYYSATCISNEATIYSISKSILTVLLPQFEQNLDKIHEPKISLRLSRFSDSVEKIVLASAEFLRGKTNPMLCLRNESEVGFNLENFLNSTIFNRMREIERGFRFIAKRNKRQLSQTQVLEDVDPFESLSKQQNRLIDEQTQSFKGTTLGTTLPAFSRQFRTVLIGERQKGPYGYFSSIQIQKLEKQK